MHSDGFFPFQGPCKGLECSFCLFSLCRIPKWSFSRLPGLKARCPLFELHARAVRHPLALSAGDPSSCFKRIFKEPIWMLNNLFYFVFLCVYFIKRKDSACGCIRPYLKLWHQIILQIYARISSLAIFAFNYRIPTTST